MTRRERLLLGGLIILLVGLLWHMRSVYQSPDSISHTADILHGGPGLFHPHHVGYTSILHGVHRSLEAVGATPDPLTLAQWHNLAWFLVACVSLVSIMHRWRWSVGTMVVVLLFYSIAAVNLEYITQAEVYIPAAAGGLALIAFATRPIVRDGLALVVLVALSVFTVAYHQAMLGSSNIPVG